MANRRVLNIVFSSSAAGDLRRALHTAGRDEEVIASSENWVSGPLIDETKRHEFFWNELGIGDEYKDESEAFWKQALGTEARRVVWFSKWSTLEYCGFLEWLRRNGYQPFEVIDLSDSYITDSKGHKVPVGCTSLIRDSEFISEAFWDQARPATSNELEDWQNLWAKLRQENAPIRVMTPDGLVSAPLDYFDNELLSHVKTQWVRTRNVVGHVMGDMLLDSFRKGGVFQTGDLLLFMRVQTMVDLGVIETKGVANISMQTWLRRPRDRSQ